MQGSHEASHNNTSASEMWVDIKIIECLGLKPISLARLLTCGGFRGRISQFTDFARLFPISASTAAARWTE